MDQRNETFCQHLTERGHAKMVKTKTTAKGRRGAAKLAKEISAKAITGRSHRDGAATRGK